MGCAFHFHREEYKLKGLELVANKMHIFLFGNFGRTFQEIPFSPEIFLFGRPIFLFTFQPKFPDFFFDEKKTPGFTPFAVSDENWLKATINWYFANLGKKGKVLIVKFIIFCCSYRSRDEVQSVRKTRDPISGLREKLLDSGLADTDDIKVPF